MAANFSLREFTEQLLMDSVIQISDPKAHMKENLVIVVESEHGKKFGGYSSPVILETNRENVILLDKSSFLFSLSHQTKHKLV
jgi:hypothetical protein